jgi:DNA-binding LacI/PurR family transcriptional regulator
MAGVRWTEIAETLRASITAGELRPGDRLPSEKVVAAQWGVCRMTAHRALSELEREGLVLRKRRVGTVVRAANEATGPGVAEELLIDGEELLPSAAGPALALLAFHMNDFPQVEYVHGVRAGLASGRHLLLCDTGNTARGEADWLRRLLAEGSPAAGVALYPTCAPENNGLIARLIERGTPVACLDRVPDALAGKEGGAPPLVDGFVTDNYGSTLAALRRTLLASGHRRIALLTSHAPEVASIRERNEAWRDALAGVGLDNPAEVDALLRRFPRGIGYNFDLLTQAVHDALFTLRHEHGVANAPTAVLCLDDFFLSAALEACDRMGLSVPGDFEILSFSDYPPLAGRLARNVHRITQRAPELGRLAAERLAERVAIKDGADAPPPPARIVRLPAVLHPAGGGAMIELGSTSAHALNAPGGVTTS